MDEEYAKKQRTNELTQREMYRRSRDTMRVYNPLSEPFKFMWDSYTQTVPAKGTKDFERYLSDHYFKKIAGRMIDDLIEAKTHELEKKREKTGNDWADLYSKNAEIMRQVPRKDNPELLKKIKDEVILGLVEEYGIEEAEEVPNQVQADRRDVFEQVLGGEDRRVVDTTQETASIPVKEDKLKVEDITV